MQQGTNTKWPTCAHINFIKFQYQNKLQEQLALLSQSEKFLGQRAFLCGSVWVLSDPIKTEKQWKRDVWNVPFLYIFSKGSKQISFSTNTQLQH